MLRAIDERYGHLVGVAPQQLRIAIDIYDRVALASLGTNGRHLCERHVAKMAALPGKYDDPLHPLGELDHATIFHDAGDATSEDRRLPRPIRVMANNTAPTSDSTDAMTARISAVVSLIWRL
jgi:hypothetical protein